MSKAPTPAQSEPAPIDSVVAAERAYLGALLVDFKGCRATVGIPIVDFTDFMLHSCIEKNAL